MFRNGKPVIPETCKACQSSLDSEDSSSFVAINDQSLSEINKPLVVFFLYSGDDSNKLCLDCYNTFKGISEFYNMCKNSQSKYTPCFRDSSDRKVVTQSTPRILSTVTPDITSSESRRQDTSELVSSSASRSVFIQNCPENTEIQCKRPNEKPQYELHHYLGIQLPKPVLNDRGCFDDDDYCYAMLEDEFARENSFKHEPKHELKFGQKCMDKNLYRFSLLNSEKIPKSHSHIAHCPFCPALIPRRKIL